MKQYLNLDLNSQVKDLSELFGAAELGLHINAVHHTAMQAIEEYAKVR